MDINKLTDFDDTSDVSDEAIAWVLKARYPATNTKVIEVRRDSRDIWARAIIMTARLIQAHHPELLIDPDLLVARKIAANIYDANSWNASAAEILSGKLDHVACVQGALAAYKQGKADSRDSG